VLQRLALNARSGLVLRHRKSVVHPLPLASRRDDPRSAEIGKMA
jgi:hypothetical protein